jgi:hypothetical protein
VRELKEELGHSKPRSPASRRSPSPAMPMTTFPPPDAALSSAAASEGTASRPQEGQVDQVGASQGKLRDYPMPPADEPLIPFLIDLL